MKLLYMTIGWISLALGAIGVMLPILPTTPFLLLATWSFAKGSKRFHTWLKNTRFYQKHMHSFVKQRAMSLKSKVMILTFASTMLLIAMHFMEAWYLRIVLILLMVFKYYYFLFKIKTISSMKTT